MDTQHEEMMERRQAGDQVDKLLMERNGLMMQWHNPCTDCVPGYVTCDGHQKIREKIEKIDSIIAKSNEIYG